MPLPDDKEIMITVPLREFLDILWGYKWKGEFADRRDKAAPSDCIIACLEALPLEVQARFFKIVKPKATVEQASTTVWEAGEWKTTGARDQELKVEADKFNFQADALSDWLQLNVTFLKPVEQRVLARQMAFTAIRSGDFEQFKLFGITDKMIEKLKTGTYER